MNDLADAATRLLPLTKAAGIPLIINDHVEVARVVQADGVHLGQEDLSIAEARALLGPHALIGKSTHSIEQALAAVAEGANYIGFGPIFPTPTKPNYASVGIVQIGQVVSQARIPVVCIGGIDARNIEQVIRAGAQCVAVVRAVCGAENPEAATRALKQQLRQSIRATPQLSL